MNKKIMGLALVIAIILIAGIPLYESFQNTLLSEQFNQSLQNASSVESEIKNTTQQFNNQNSTDADVLISTINNEITPKYSEELLLLNASGVCTDDDNEKEYIDLQNKRVNLESRNLNATVTTLNAISQYVKGEKTAEDAQTSLNNANTELTTTNTELNQVYSDIRTLLEKHPDLNKKVHDLNLEDSFYGIQSSQNQTQNNTNITNTTQ